MMLRCAWGPALTADGLMEEQHQWHESGRRIDVLREIDGSIELPDRFLQRGLHAGLRGTAPYPIAVCRAEWVRTLAGRTGSPDIGDLTAVESGIAVGLALDIEDSVG